jgi:hypothetical protein
MQRHTMQQWQLRASSQQSYMHSCHTLSTLCPEEATTPSASLQPCQLNTVMSNIWRQDHSFATTGAVPLSPHLNNSRQKPRQLSQSGRTLAALSCGQSFCRSVWGQKCLSTARASGLAWSHLSAAVLADQTTACQRSQVSASVLACQCFWYLLAAN